MYYLLQLHTPNETTYKINNNFVFVKHLNSLPQRNIYNLRLPENSATLRNLIYEWACSHTDRTKDNNAGGECVF